MLLLTTKRVALRNSAYFELLLVKIHQPVSLVLGESIKIYRSK